MIIDITAQTDQFELLVLNPFGWQVMLNSNINAVKGDSIRYIEIYSDKSETGRTAMGLIRWVSNGDEVIDNNDTTIAYCDVISLPIGLAAISTNLIVG